jgi:hypothetical protein
MPVRQKSKKLPFVSLEDLVRAYRHTKTELYSERTIPSVRALLSYESSLMANLKALQRKLNEAEDAADLLGDSSSSLVFSDEDLLGKILHQPKKLDFSCDQDSRGSEPHIYVSDAKARWEEMARRRSPSIQYRTVAVPGIEFQIIGTLWTMKVGRLLDEKLLPVCRGNRLKRDDDTTKPEVPGEVAGPYGESDSPGLFRPYYFAYRKWRQDGLNAIQRELENDHRVIAITMDLTSYFHRIDPSFLEDSAFWTEIFGATLDECQERLNRLMCGLLKLWAARSPEETGLPVGLLVSRLIANALLHEFDTAVQENLNPIFYARYVDDILLVLRPLGKMQGAPSVMKFIADQLGSGVAEVKEDSLTLRLRLKHVGRTRLEFGAGKQRIFDLEGKAGLDLLASIRRDIDELSSEFRLMPDVSEGEDSVLRKALITDHDLEMGADSLRKADSLTIRRLGLAILLRNHELLERCMNDPEEWAKIREPFYRLIEEHVLTPERYCTYYQYLPRIFGLIAANGDWAAGERLLLKLEWIHDELSRLNEGPHEYSATHAEK